MPDPSPLDFPRWTLSIATNDRLSDQLGRSPRRDRPRKPAGAAGTARRRLRVDPGHIDPEIAPRGDERPSRARCRECGRDRSDESDESDDGAIGPADLTVGGLAWLVVIGVTWISVAGVAGAVLWAGSGVYRMLGGSWGMW